MRVIAGSLGGRQFSAPKGHKTHPMSDKVRGALFNSLGDISGLGVLDAYAGSGALSFEAVSRGASSALAIDSDNNAARTIKENIKILAASQVRAVQASISAWLGTSYDVFDLVLADPPYDRVSNSLIVELANRVKLSGIVVVSLPPKQDIDLGNGFEHLETKLYGDAKLVFWRRIA